MQYGEYLHTLRVLFFDTMIQVGIGFYDIGLVGEPFYYELPEELSATCGLGSCVQVELSGIARRGVIVSFNRTNEELVLGQVRTLIIHPFGSLLNKTQCNLILWISWYYRSPFHKVLRLFIPEKIWLGTFSPVWEYLLKVPKEAPVIGARLKKQIELQEFLVTQAGEVLEEKVLGIFSKPVIKKAVEEGYLIREALRLIPPSLVKTESVSVEKQRKLTREQQNILHQMTADPQGQFLLFGITGSGKTEIYVELAKKMEQEGKQTCVLVPEIALTTQLIHYFQRSFGEKLSVFHSKLAEGERLQQWCRVRAGESTIILGSRSALFAPFQSLGALILDEEHEWTYKNESNPRYHTRSVAKKLQELAVEAGAPFTLVFGSGTPSIETMFATTREGGSSCVKLELKKKIYDQEAQ